MAEPLDDFPGLARGFVDFDLLPTLLSRASTPGVVQTWARMMRDAGVRTDFVEEGAMAPGRVHEFLADDAWELAQRLDLVAASSADVLTPAGVRLAQLEDAGPDFADLREGMGWLVEAYYARAHEVSVSARLRQAVRRVGLIDTSWNRYVPGLLLAEFEFLLSAVAHGRLTWAQMISEVERIRRDASRRLGAPSARRMRNIVDYADAVTALHWQAADGAPEPRMTIVEAQATAMLFLFSNLLGLGGPLGPVQHLVAPWPAPTARPTPVFPEGAVAIGADYPVEWIPPIGVGEAAGLLRRVPEQSFRTDTLIFRRLSIDRPTRKATRNPLPVKKGKTDDLQNARWMCRALSMELLAAITLTGLDNPDLVRCYCRQLNGHPNYFAPAGYLDLLVLYGAVPGTPAFGIGVEVSARGKDELDIGEYKQQARQGLKHAAQELDASAGRLAKMYVLVVNSRDITEDESIWTACKEVLAEPDTPKDPRIKLVPMSTRDFAFAADRMDYAYWDDHGERFGPRELALVLDAHVEVLEQDNPPMEDDWIRTIWKQAEDPMRFGGVLAPPDDGEDEEQDQEPPRPKSTSDPSPS